MRSLSPAVPPVGGPSEEQPVGPSIPVTCGTVKTASCPPKSPRPAAPHPPTQRAVLSTESPACPASPPLPPLSPTPPPGFCMQRPLQPRPKQCAAACPCGSSCSCWPSWLRSCSWFTKPWRPTPSTPSKPLTQKWPVAAQRRAHRSCVRGKRSSLLFLYVFCSCFYFLFFVFFFQVWICIVAILLTGAVKFPLTSTPVVFLVYFLFLFCFFISFSFLTKSSFTESLKRCDKAISVTIQGSPWHLWKDSCASTGVFGPNSTSPYFLNVLL